MAVAVRAAIYDEYLESRLRAIMESMLQAMLKKKPEDDLEGWCIDWLKEYHKEQDADQQEIVKLRAERDLHVRRRDELRKQLRLPPDMRIQIRQRLELLKPGECEEFGKKLKDDQRALVFNMSSEMCLWAREEGKKGERTSVTVFNLLSFAEQAHERLEALEANQTTVFHNRITSQQRRAVRLICEELGRICADQEDGTLAVANMQDFLVETRSDLQYLKPGQSKVYGKGVTSMHRAAIERIASDLDMECIHAGQGAKKTTTVKREWRAADLGIQ